MNVAVFFQPRVNQKGRSKISSRRDEARINYSLAVEDGRSYFSWTLRRLGRLSTFSELSLVL